ncbi:MAG: Fe-S cluster assembly ATPase SufC [Candidatus Bathyarchaeia archaeon]
MKLLEIDGLQVDIEGKTVLKDINLGLEEGENYILFGPNGSGKTTLINAIMGIPPTRIQSGNIKYKGQDINGLDVSERAERGISIGFQHPPEIEGVKLSEMLKICLDKGRDEEFSDEELQMIERFRLKNFLDRDINVGFSGGERKRAEILQMIFLKPRLLLLDEPDSGVDVESLILVAEELQRYLEDTGSSALIITHKGDILEYVKAKYACVLLDGRVHCFAQPRDIYNEIKRSGYEACVSCRVRVEEDWEDE